MNKKGMSLVIAVMISMVIFISLSGVIIMFNYQRNTVFNNINDTKRAFLAEAGMNLGLKWLQEKTRGQEANLDEFPSKTFVIDGTNVTVSGSSTIGAVPKYWSFTSIAKIDGRTCKVTVDNVVPAKCKFFFKVV